MNPLENLFYRIRDFFSIRLVTFGQNEITLWTVIYIFILLFLLFYFTAKLKNWLVYKILKNTTIDLGVRLAIGNIIRYIVLVIGIYVALETAGVDLSALTILAGALGVGVGFGLQNIMNNLISGIIILFERPIKINDRIQVGNVTGGVKKISIRSTTILTNDNISIIVPNSEFISSQVINWSHNDSNIRIHIPVGVSYNEDPEKIKEILLKVAGNEKDVLKLPAPDVLFTEYADSSLNFDLRVWTSKWIHSPADLKSKLYYSIFKEFKLQNVEIPFPQRDIHIKNPEGQIKSS